MPKSNRADNRSIKDHAWLATHGKKEMSGRTGGPQAAEGTVVTPTPDYVRLLELLAALPKDRLLTLAELVELRRTVAPSDPNAARASLAERFLLPPFSVLDARQGYWQKRKKMWLALGIQSELGRGENYGDNGSLGISEQARSHYANATSTGRPETACQAQPDGQGEKYARGDGRGRPLATTFGSGGPGDLAAGFRGRGAHPTQSAAHDGLAIGITCGAYDSRHGGELTPAQSGTSIFDPVLCEIAYRWFCPAGGRVLDPFAGGSVRGVVAARLGRAYAGVDLRPEQAEANYAQAEVLCPDADLTWAVGDSVGIADMLPGEYDLVFSCPPYADLERYSDDPRDLSTMGYGQFLDVYRAIIAASCAMLKEDRFAVFVVGDVRDRATGNYRGFVGDTVAAFRAAGLELYNEAVLVTAVGSLPIRVGKQFAGYRKLGKTHQNVLVFVKGDAGRAAAACGEVDVDDLEMPECVAGGVALCRQDVRGTVAEPCLMGCEADVAHVYLPTAESYLLVDVLRGQARATGGATPRAWLGAADGWQRIEEGADLTYLLGDVVYLNRAVFPDARGRRTPHPRRGG